MLRVDWPPTLAPSARALAPECGIDPQPPSGWNAVASVRALGDDPPRSPTLWLVTAGELDSALAGLREQDDLVVNAAPPSLLLHRLDRLARDGLRLDSLTGLFTPLAFRERGAGMVDEASPMRPMSLLLIDIDHFKRLNDERGHGVGDTVLVEVAARLRDVTPAFCVCARVAGDEFAVMGPMDEDESTVLAERLLNELRKPIAHHEAGRRESDGPIRITASIGVATTDERIAVVDWLSMASDACYAVKAQGRNGVAHQMALEREALEADRDPMMVGFENLTQVVSERVGELIRVRGRRLFASLRSEADHDALTGLNGRRYLDRRVPFELEEAREAGRPLTLALLDLDRFGQVNKTYGWVAGDAVLREASRRVMEATRDQDWVARYGGEEIALVLANTSAVDAESVLERVRLALGDVPFELPDGTKIQVTASFGAADSVEVEGNTRAIFERVGDRLLAAKDQGRNRVVVAG